MSANRGESPRFARNDKINYFFRILFGLWTFNFADSKCHRLKSVLLEASSQRLDLRGEQLFRYGDGGGCRDSQIVRGAPQPDTGFDARVAFRLPQHGPDFLNDVHIRWR